MEKTNVIELDFNKLFKIKADSTTVTKTHGTDINCATCFGGRPEQQDSLQVDVITNFVGYNNTIVQDAILRASNQVGEYCNQFFSCGTTLTSALVFIDDAMVTNIITTNIGDSGIFLIQQLANNNYSCERLTDIHNFDEASKEEQARITNDEKLQLEKNVANKTYIIYPTKGINKPCKLLLTRSLGHGDILNISPNASIKLKQDNITKEKKSFLILFSDGFSDHVDENILRDFFKYHMQIKSHSEDQLATQLCHLAYAIQNQKASNRNIIKDNITVIVIPLHNVVAEQAVLATVCDGHGANGHEPAEQASQLFHTELISNLNLVTKHDDNDSEKTEICKLDSDEEEFESNVRNDEKMSDESSCSPSFFQKPSKTVISSLNNSASKNDTPIRSLSAEEESLDEPMSYESDASPIASDPEDESKPSSSYSSPVY